MESRLRRCRWCRGPHPLAGWLAGWLTPPPRDGWLGRSAFALTKRTWFFLGRRLVPKREGLGDRGRTQGSSTEELLCKKFIASAVVTRGEIELKQKQMSPRKPKC